MEVCFTINELVINILQWIDSGSDYKNIRLVSHHWYVVAGDKIDQYSNHLWTIILYVYPNVDWKNFPEHLFLNPNSDWRKLLNYLNTGEHKYVDFERGEIANFVHKRYIRPHQLFMHSEVDMELIQNINFPSTDWSFLSANPNITPEIIEKYPTLPWNSHGLSENPNITPAFVAKHKEIKWNTRALSYNSNFYIDLTKENQQLFLLQTYWLSSHPKITWDMMLKHPHIKWDMGGVSANPNLTKEIILSYSSLGETMLEWDWIQIAGNPGIPLDFIESKKEITTYYNYDYYISKNTNLTWRYVRDHPEIKWDFAGLANNYFTKSPYYRKNN